MENVRDEKNDSKNDEEKEIIHLENINDTNDNKKQYRYRRLYDIVRMKSCLDKSLVSSKKWFFLLLCIMLAMMILFFGITYSKVMTIIFQRERYG